MENIRTIEVLNKLIQMNNDRFESYETAFKETEEQALKTQFSKFMLTSQKCKQQLVDEVVRYGGTPTNSTTTAGKFFRIWMDVKAALTGKDRRAILSSCQYGENMALETYQKVLSEDMENLSFEQQNIINAQHALIKTDCASIKTMLADSEIIS